MIELDKVEGREKHVNYDKFEIATKVQKLKKIPKCFSFLPFERCYMISN